MKTSTIVRYFVNQETLNTCGCNNMTGYIDFSVTSFKRESLMGNAIITKPTCLSRDNYLLYETICQLINLFLSFTFQEMKQIDLFTVGRLAFLFSCLPLLFSACFFFRPCETFMNAAFYKSAGKSATSSATITVFWKNSSNL